MEQAAVLIQSKFRQFQAKNRVSVMRHEKKAATKIQAGYRGFKARQHVRHMRSQSEDYTELVTTDNVEDAAKLAESSLPDLHDGELEDVQEMEKAAIKIQAGYRGFRTRKQMKMEQSEKAEDTEPEEDEMEEEDDLGEEDIDDDVSASSEMTKEKATLIIQAGIRGMLARRSIQGEMPEEQELQDAAAAAAADDGGDGDDAGGDHADADDNV